MTPSEDTSPNRSPDFPADPAASQLSTESSTENSRRQDAERLREAVANLASNLRPFPSFFGMSTLQAIELELPADLAPQAPSGLGCVVVLPDGEISELDLRLISGPDSASGFDQVEEFTELELSSPDYIVYATVAVQQLQAEMDRRGAE